MTHDQIATVVRNVMADNMLAFCVSHATLTDLVTQLDRRVRIADPDTDQPTYVRVRDLAESHVRLY